MKRFASICCALALAVSPIGFSGCVTTTKPLPELSAENSDQVILRAEQTAEAAKLTFNTFVHLEYDNQDLLASVTPNIHKWAEHIRRNGIGWIQSLRTATKTFKANRTTENRANLDTILKTLTSAVSETKKYLDQSKKVTNP